MRGLLISWATPAASWPNDASFSDWKSMSCWRASWAARALVSASTRCSSCSAFLRSLMSRQTHRISFPSGITTALVQISTA